MSARRSWTAGRVLAPLLAVAIAVGLATPAGASASSATGGAGSTTGWASSATGGASSTTGGAGSATVGAGSTTGGVGVRSTTEGNPRLGHVTDRANDVYTRAERAFSARELRTVDITRFGYHFGRETAKFTIRTRELRRVKGAATSVSVGVLTRSRAGVEAVNISAEPTYSIVHDDEGHRYCPGRQVTWDRARHTVTIRVPMKCLSREAAPTSMQARGAAALLGDDRYAYDETSYSRRADLRS